jgi:hypothetical protein
MKARKFPSGNLNRKFTIVSRTFNFYAKKITLSRRFISKVNNFKKVDSNINLDWGP